MIPNRAKCSLVISERLVGRIAQVKVKPNHASIETSNNQVVSTGVDVHGGNPTATRNETFHHGLLHEMVHTDVLLTCDKQKGLVRVKACQLRLSFGFAKRLLRAALAELMD